MYEQIMDNNKNPEVDSGREMRLNVVHTENDQSSVKGVNFS